MLHMKNLGVTKGEGVLKIQTRSVCSRALFMFLCNFSGTEANSGHKENKKTVQSAPDHHHLLHLSALLITFTLFLSHCGY